MIFGPKPLEGLTARYKSLAIRNIYPAVTSEGESVV